MKRFLLLFLLAVQIAFAQAPQSFKYQAVARDGSGVLMVNKIISIKTSILAGTATGSVVYAETQTLATNDYGVVTLNIGAGTVVSGSFPAINWGTNTFYVKTELDVNGGSNYLFMGTSQIMSVPYALYAEKSGNALADNDTSKTNELQTLSITGHTLSISQKNSIVLPSDADSDITNELQTLSLTGTTLTISGGNSIKLNGAVDLDFDPTNELQLLSRGNDTLYLSKGNFVVLPKDNDRDSTNEIQNLTINQGTVKISKANSIHLPDSSATNEIQNLTLTQGTLKISNSNSVHLPDSSATNEIQNLSITSDSLKISKGNSVPIMRAYDENFPEGINGIQLIASFPGNQYIVPAGYNFYLLNNYQSINNYKGVNMNLYSLCDGFEPLIFGSGDTINFNPNFHQSGYIIKKRGVPLFIPLAFGTQYTVPTGKILIINSAISKTSGSCVCSQATAISIDNGMSYSYIGSNLFISSGHKIEMTAGSCTDVYVFGLLLDN